MSAKELKNINVRFEQNVNKFSRLQGAKEVHKNKDLLQQHIDNSKITYRDPKHIQAYIDRCNSDQISMEVIKANIRILNAMTDIYKKGYAKLSYIIIEQQLEEKISLAKRDFVKRECRLAMEILNLLKTNSVEDVFAYLKSKYSTT